MMHGQNASPLAPQATLEEALARLHESEQAAISIVEPTTGAVVGFLTRSAAADAPVFSLPVPRLGGMATPLGVYLTDGVYSGGPGFWGLVLTGMALCALAFAAQTAVLGILNFIDASAFGRLLSGSVLLPAWLRQAGMTLGPTWLTILLLFTLLRLLPMSGTHGAEHQVVHCVERRLPLTAAWVRAMPRVHPRCGTNLVIGVALFQSLFFAAFSAAQAAALPIADAATLALLLAAPVTFGYWRRLGGWMQQWFATKPATEAQIAGAIRAAEAVLVQRVSAPSFPGFGLSPRFRGIRRIWTMGLVQVMLGYGIVFLLLLLAAHSWAWLGRILEI